MTDTNLVQFKNKYYSLGGVLRRSMEVSLSGASTEYVNEQDAILSGVSEGNFVNISGDIMGGPLYLNENPTLAMQAATKQYVDDQVSTVSGLAGGNYVSVSGDTMVGSLAITNGNLSIKTHANYPGSDYIETTAACQTIDSLPVIIQQISINEGYAYWFESITIGKKISSGLSKLRLEMNRGCVYRDIGASTILVASIDNTLTRSIDAYNYGVTISVSGNNLLTQVSGSSLETVNWVTTLKYQKIG